ncbi:MAG: hypothetical protein RL766_2099 [Bacteroidota bacterium]|jgi:hypothetical protein
MPFTSSLLYRALVPKPLRTAVLLSSLRKRIPAFLSHPPFANDSEVQQVAEFVRANGVGIFPYPFTSKYKKGDIVVYTDDQNGLKYVLMDGKRLYFKRKWSADRIRRSFHDLTLEQDEASPHRYLSSTFNLSKTDVVADFGAAEGNFALAVIEKVSKIYLFECDPEWIEALQYTFAPWKDKVEIIPKFVSDSNDERHCSGDVFFRDKEVTFLKIDVDGGERPLLKGFKQILHNRANLRIALCTYHQHDDESEFTDLLNTSGFKVSPSQGYMIFYYDKKLKPPYIRRGLIRGVK